jgi:hypothetical protein
MKSSFEAFSEASPQQRRARDTSVVSLNATRDDVDTRAYGAFVTAMTAAILAHAQDAIPGLLDDIVIAHVLRSEYFDDPADLARLPA